MWTMAGQVHGLRDVGQGRGFVDNVDMWTIDFKSVNPLWARG
jgi:hypothetical protein